MKKNISVGKNKRKAALAHRSNFDLLQNKNGFHAIKKQKENKTINNTIGINLTINNHPKQLKNHKFTSNREIFLGLAFKSKSRERLHETYSKDLLDQNSDIRSITPIKMKQSPIKKQKSNVIILDKNKLRLSKRNNSNKLTREQKKQKINLDSINNNLNDIFHSSFSSRNGYEDNKINNQEEILEYKLVNNRLKNEIQILTEKNKSLNDLIEIKNKDIDILKNKNNALYFETNMEINLLKEKYEKNYILTCKKYERSIKVINSMINVVIELYDLFLNNENNINNNNFVLNNFNTSKNKSVFDFSLDMYENTNNNINNSNSFAEIASPVSPNYNNISEKKKQLLKQIQEILIEKINYITNELEIVLETKTLDKLKQIRSLNFKSTTPTSPTMNFKKRKSVNDNFNLNNNSIINNNNISNNEDLLCSISKIQASMNDVDGFDFSVSKSFYKESHCSQEGSSSPKFNKSTRKEGNDQKISIFGEDKSLGISFESAKNNEDTKKFKEISFEPGKITNLLEYSMADLVEAIGSKSIKNKVENQNNGKLEEKENINKANVEISNKKESNECNVLKKESSNVNFDEKNKIMEDKIAQLNEKMRKEESNFDNADVNNFTLKDS